MPRCGGGKRTLTLCPFEELNLLEPLLGLIFRLVRSAEILTGLLGYYFVAFFDFLDHEASCLLDAVKVRQAASVVEWGEITARSVPAGGSARRVKSQSRSNSLCWLAQSATKLRLAGFAIRRLVRSRDGNVLKKESEMAM